MGPFAILWPGFHFLTILCPSWQCWVITPCTRPWKSWNNCLKLYKCRDCHSIKTLIVVDMVLWISFKLVSQLSIWYSTLFVRVCLDVCQSSCHQQRPVVLFCLWPVPKQMFKCDLDYCPIPPCLFSVRVCVLGVPAIHVSCSYQAAFWRPLNIACTVHRRWIDK